MTSTAVIFLLVMVIAASKLARHSLIVLAVMASIAGLAYVLAGHR